MSQVNFSVPSQQDLLNPHLLLTTLKHLRQTVEQEGEGIFQQWRPHIQRQDFLSSALNLAHYLILRRQDLRPIQMALMPWGLCSLSRVESRVLANLDAVITTLGLICAEKMQDLPPHPRLPACFEGDRLLHQQTEAVFGPTPAHRRGRIMVTLPTEAAEDETLMRELLLRGTDCVRINCAHDDAAQWQKMIERLRQAELETGRTCKVLMDLGGPKPRTGSIQAIEPKQRFVMGDYLFLTAALPPLTKNDLAAFTEVLPGRSLEQLTQVNCTLPEVLPQLQVGARVWINDGKLGTQVVALTPQAALLQVTHARPKGERLRSDKGLNFPETALHLNPLTPKDIQDLDFVATHADIVGYSFVQSAADITLLQQMLALRRQSLPPLAIVAKIETPLAVQNLPELIVQAAGKQPFGVMIARGDLAVEIGYQRLAEIQEEILWLCEAAHIPVIWATQVLETLVKNGIPSRAEVTDAAMGERAECVMLNKGPFLLEAIPILDNLLTRMQSHQLKKTPQLRALQVWAGIGV